MSALLDILAALRDVRADAEIQFRRAIVKASREGRHTGREIASAAGLSRQRISQIIQQERSTEK